MTRRNCNTNRMLSSPMIGHNASTVFAFLRKLIPTITGDLPDTKYIHYISDSPTSQYRNKFIFSIVANHFNLLGIHASWHYFEAGHGKGPCDGIGAVVKRMADNAVKRGSNVIQDAASFFAWAEKSNGAIKFLFVGKQECTESGTELRSQQLVPVKGTLSVHSVFGIDAFTVSVREACCFDPCCFENGVFKLGDNKWSSHIVRVREAEISDDDLVENPVTEDVPLDNTVNYEIGEFVAALYGEGSDVKWYIGKVLGVDNEDSDIHISFMKTVDLKGKLSFRWPNIPDEIWVNMSEVLLSVTTPVGARRGVFTLPEADIVKVQAAFDEHKSI